MTSSCVTDLFIVMTSVLGMKELSPPAVSLRKLYQETIATEPTLIIISTGADPSQELLELANEIVGHDRFHQVSA